MISIMKTGGFVDAAAWKSRPPVWHLEVKTTVGGRDDEFPISGAEFERVSGHPWPWMLGYIAYLQR